MIEAIGLASAIALPMCNIPLILKIRRRKSSADISMIWVLGVEVCLLGMLPASLVSGDTVFKVFSIVNCLFFSIVVFQVIRYR